MKTFLKAIAATVGVIVTLFVGCSPMLSVGKSKIEGKGTTLAE